MCILHLLSIRLRLQVAPWSKTGGLGDVCGSLPPALAARGHRVMVVAPRYADYDVTPVEKVDPFPPKL